jgi:hypothetical protein
VRDLASRSDITCQWTRAEYDRPIDLGILDEDGPIELLGGEMVAREPQVYGEPARSPQSRDGWRYRRIERFGPEAMISPLASPRARVRVKSLLP